MAMDLTIKRDARGRFLTRPDNSAPPITTANAHEMLAKRRERKQAVLQAAANQAVERDDWRITHGDMAFVAAIANTAMLKATTPDDPKAIDAARFLLQETGIAEPRAQDPSVQAAAPAIDALARLVSAISDAIARDTVTVDASSTDAAGDAGDADGDGGEIR